MAAKVKKMAETVNREPRRGLTFDDVWASLMELREIQAENAREMRENAREMRENALEAKERQEKAALEAKKRRDDFDREMKERQEKAAREMRESKDDFNLRLGKLTDLFGDFTIGMVAPMLRKKFEEFGLVFTRSNPNALVDDYKNDIHFEIDIMLENNDKAVLIEVKTKLTKERILKHIERL